ncbi:MAG: hypothetical protein KatS3mg065_1054 [Chloroflexota bacterium]|nr:MAG: hypothetical protein KatS3mg065_1054 [Chloroflexota bacterium]
MCGSAPAGKQPSPAGERLATAGGRRDVGRRLDPRGPVIQPRVIRPVRISPTDPGRSARGTPPPPHWGA